MAEWIEVPAHRIYVICARELRDGFDFIRENGRPAAHGDNPYRFVRKRTAKFLSWRASFRNIAKFITARRSKRYDFKELGDQRPKGWLLKKVIRMNQQSFSLFAGIIFIIIALLHLVRIIYGWDP